MSEEALNPEDAQKPEAAPNAAVPSAAAPSAEALEMQRLLQQNEAARHEIVAAREKPAVTPTAVKVAAILAIVHGGLLALNAVLAAQTSGDVRMVPYNVIWLGFNIFLAGALFERQTWAWWGVTMLGGIVAILNLLKVVGFLVYRTSGMVEDTPPFSPVLVGGASAIMLLAVLLLALPEAKKACGTEKKAPGQF